MLVATGVKYILSGKKSLSTNTQSPTTKLAPTDIPLQTVIAEGLDTPWSLTFLPDGGILITERPGRVRLIDSSGNLQDQPITTLSQVKEVGEGGLLGMVSDPKFESNHYIYFYYTYSTTNANSQNRIVRMVYDGNKLSNEKVLVDKIPGSSNHDGGRLKFGPDGYLYATTGDAENPSQAQDKNSLGGKILRLTTDGKVAPGNPFGTLVYSYGHRNPQGLSWDSSGQLWATEHGRSIPVSGLDELNKISPGQNYGWPVIQGNETKRGMITPVINSGGSTWAPADTAIIGNKIFFGGLKGQALFEANLPNPSGVVEQFKNEFGRIREVILGPDGMLYITTSNNDGRGTPNLGDDKVIRINPQKLQ